MRRGLGSGRAALSLLATIGLAVGAIACRNDSAAVGSASADALPPWASADATAPPRPGMVFLPKGTLIAGTPLDRVPRVPDAELPGEPIELEGFYADVFLHPNEPGAIPTTNVTRDEAQALCQKEGKRLCTEIELERACKGPNNTTYPTGDAYAPEACDTGRKGDALAPNGYHAACVSGFGVHDTHGTAWLWTDSDFGRDSEGLVTLKGGNSPYGELVGRCAHVRGVKPTVHENSIGFRCCFGPKNEHKLELSIAHGPALRYRREDKKTQLRFEEKIAQLPAINEGPVTSDARGGSDVAHGFRVERIWVWHPLGNEELLLAGGCSLSGGVKQCGVFAGREIDADVRLLVFVSSDRWQPTIGEGTEPRSLHVQGGDGQGAFRKVVAWDWGKVSIFAKERKKGKNRWVGE